MAFFIGQDFVKPLVLRTLRGDVECGTGTEVLSKQPWENRRSTSVPVLGSLPNSLEL